MPDNVLLVQALSDDHFGADLLRREPSRHRPVMPVQHLNPFRLRQNLGRVVGVVLRVLEADERRRSVQTAVLALPTEYREVVILRHFTGLSYDEIAEATGLPAKTVKSRLHTAKERLGQMLVGWEAQK